MRIAALLLSLCPLFAQPRPAERVYAGNRVIPHVVDGASWKTIMTLVNLDTQPTGYTIRFYANDGTPLTVDTTEGRLSVLTGSIPVGGLKIIETPGTKAGLSEGWAMLETRNTIGGYAIFRQSG